MNHPRPRRTVLSATTTPPATPTPPQGAGPATRARSNETASWKADFRAFRQHVVTYGRAEDAPVVTVEYTAANTTLSTVDDELIQFTRPATMRIDRLAILTEPTVDESVSAQAWVTGGAATGSGRKPVVKTDDCDTLHDALFKVYQARQAALPLTAGLDPAAVFAHPLAPAPIQAGLAAYPALVNDPEMTPVRVLEYVEHYLALATLLIQLGSYPGSVVSRLSSPFLAFHMGDYTPHGSEVYLRVEVSTLTVQASLGVTIPFPDGGAPGPSLHDRLAVFTQALDANLATWGNATVTYDPDIQLPVGTTGRITTGAIVMHDKEDEQLRALFPVAQFLRAWGHYTSYEKRADPIRLLEKDVMRRAQTWRGLRAA